jgi:hypothetical protein
MLARAPGGIDPAPRRSGILACDFLHVDTVLRRECLDYPPAGR